MPVTLMLVLLSCSDVVASHFVVALMSYFNNLRYFRILYNKLFLEDTLKIMCKSALNM
jgi:hypothetical protein